MTDLEYTLCVSNFIQYLWVKMQSLLDAKIINTQQLHKHNWQYKYHTDTTIHAPCSYCNTTHSKAIESNMRLETAEIFLQILFNRI